ncbi:MAG TPA: YihY/virulence factor BrkB family protein [Mycobacteriales bacterium]|nr:YihY/virulence factor BrkB family protein [Mycobacteriales bacterium]
MDFTPRRTLTVTAVAGAAYAAGRRKGKQGKQARPALPPGGTAPVTSGDPARNGRPGQDQPQGSRGGAQVPGREADAPTQIPAQGWKQILKRAWKEQNEDNIGLISAGVAYYAFTALFPALIAAVTLYGLVADPMDVADQARNLTETLPPESAKIITDQLTSVAGNSSGALGVGLVVSVLAALFSASGGVGNIIKAVNIAYDEDETRGFLKLRGLALLLTLGAVVFVVVAIGLIAVLPALFDNLGLGSFGTVVANVLRWVGLVVFMLVALAVLYRYAPDRDSPKFRWVGLGAGVATLLWIVASAALSFYVSNFGSYGKTYGALAGVIVLLLWLYITAFIVLLGAEINSESEQQTEKDSTEGPEKPMGERQAVKADTVAG